MIFVTQELLFFSLNNLTAEAFERYVKYTGKEFKEFSEFRLIRQEEGKAKTFRHIKELVQFLDILELVRLANLILVIDPYSLKDEEQDKRIIEELIVGYPEVKLVFLTNASYDWKEHFNWDAVHLKCQIEAQDKCVCKDHDSQTDNINTSPVCKLEFPYIHSLNYNGYLDYDFDLLIRGQSNLFDASNLRCIVKQIIFNNIKIRTNFPKNQCNRNHNFALVAEEEIQQAYFNSYALYINGFRALPVISCKELKDLAENSKDPNYSPEAQSSHFKLIIRDYDLQYEDYKAVDVPLNKLRGISYNKTLQKWQMEDELTLWKDLCNCKKTIQTWFVTRLNKHKSEKSVPQINNTDFKKCTTDEIKYGIRISENKEKAYLRGLSKPLNGLYEIHKINVVKESFAKVKETSSIIIKRDDDSDDSHSTPPTIFHIANSLLTRSQNYYKGKMYMLSALLAKEALEILNGFHFMMMLKAIYLYSIAETSLVMDSLGANEDILSDNTRISLDYIKKIVQRICEDNPKAMENVLGQIYNDIRHICKDKEQFKSADIALNEMVNIRHGRDFLKAL